MQTKKTYTAAKTSDGVLDPPTKLPWHTNGIPTSPRRRILAMQEKPKPLVLDLGAQMMPGQKRELLGEAAFVLAQFVPVMPQ